MKKTRKLRLNSIEVFEKIAKSGKPVKPLDPHWAYESELEERLRRTNPKLAAKLLRKKAKK